MFSKENMFLKENTFYIENTYAGAASGGRERVLFIGTQFSILYTSMYSPAGAATFASVSGGEGDTCI
jgi:hypothetical protein